MTRYRAIFTDGTASPFDVVEVPFAGEPSLWRAGEGVGALASSPDRAASRWADSLLARLSIDGDHATGLREIVPPGEMSRAEMTALAAQRDELIATLLDRKELDARAAVYADRLLAEARAQVEALTAERDRYREVATTSDSDAEREAIAWADRVVALEARVLALRTMLATSRREHDDLRDAEYSSGKPGPVEEYLAEIDAELAALPTETS